jgi:hypothetical protein
MTTPYNAQQVMRPAPSHLVFAILVTLFCCQPFGIVAIVFAALTMSRNGEGNYAGAWAYSDKAKFWCWLGFGIGLGVIALWMLFSLFAVVVSA